MITLRNRNWVVIYKRSSSIKVYSQYANNRSQAGKPPADFIFDPSRNFNSYTHPDLFLFGYQGGQVLVRV